MRLKDKVALIAGAGPRMGQAPVLFVAQEEAKARNPSKGQETARLSHTFFNDDVTHQHRTTWTGYIRK